MGMSVETLGVLRPCSVRGCRGEGLWKPVVIIPYRPHNHLAPPEWTLAEASLDLHFCAEHRRNVDQNDIITIATKAFWSSNNPFRVETDGHRITVRWERSNPGVIVKDGA